MVKYITYVYRVKIKIDEKVGENFDKIFETENVVLLFLERCINWMAHLILSVIERSRILRADRSKPLAAESSPDSINIQDKMRRLKFTAIIYTWEHMPRGSLDVGTNAAQEKT